ncbi:hypothetical protein BGX26_012356 [Mortierella sp. AD094]|nr:hypothetical protein BGX26_012356 [Mortierella sp. AD094]
MPKALTAAWQKPSRKNEAPATQRTPSITRSLVIFFAAVAVSTSSIATTADAALAPYPVGGFAMCQTKSALYMQGGVGYGPTATYLATTNQHFRLDLSKGFDSSLSSTNPPTWVNLTSDYSPYQRFHSGDCTPDKNSFLTIGNADEVNTGSSGSGFLMAYSISKGTWSAVNQAVSGTTFSNSPGKGQGKGNGGNGAGNAVSAAGRTMVGFAFGVGNGVNSSATSLGVAVGGGWIPPTASTPSAFATDLTNLATEVDLMATGSDGSLGSLTWSIAPNNGNGGNNVNTNLGAAAGTKVVILPSGGKAVILGGVSNSLQGGLGFLSVRILDMTTGAVVLQKTSGSVFPAPRYGHCVAPSSDGNTIFMFGGAFASNDQLTTDFFTLDTRTWTWSMPAIKNSPPAVRDHQCTVVGNQFMSFFGFNSNQAPASGQPLASNGTGATIPSAPPIYVLSTSQWVWSTQFTPLPGTPSPPPAPSVPTDGSNGKVGGAAIAFSTIFGLAFLGVIGYMVYAHKRRQRRKAERLQLVELENQKKEEARLEKERQQRMQQDVPLPPTPPMMAHTYNSNYHSQGYGDGNLNSGPIGVGHYPPAPPPPTSGAYGQTHDPFQDPNYNQHLYSEPHHALGQYYNNSNAVTTNPFDPQQTSRGLPLQQGSTAFVPEEMGHVPPPGGSPFVSEEMGHVPPPGGSPFILEEMGHVPLVASAGQTGGFGRSAGDKTSFIEADSDFRGR